MEIFTTLPLIINFFIAMLNTKEGKNANRMQPGMQEEPDAIGETINVEGINVRLDPGEANVFESGPSGAGRSCPNCPCHAG